MLVVNRVTFVFQVNVVDTKGKSVPSKVSTHGILVLTTERWVSGGIIEAGESDVLDPGQRQPPVWEAQRGERGKC